MLYHDLLRLLPSHELYHGLHLSLLLSHVLQGQIYLLLLHVLHLHASLSSSLCCLLQLHLITQQILLHVLLLRMLLSPSIIRSLDILLCELLLPLQGTFLLQNILLRSLLLNQLRYLHWHLWQHLLRVLLPILFLLLPALWIYLLVLHTVDISLVAVLLRVHIRILYKSISS